MEKIDNNIVSPVEDIKEQPVQSVVEETKLSKNQLKKQKKTQKWLEIKQHIKEKNKLKKKKRNNKGLEHFKRFQNLTNENGEPLNLSKKEKKDMYKELCEQGSKVIIDCDFESLMIDKEKSSICQQIALCYATNKKFEKPINLHLCGIGPYVQDKLSVLSYDKWIVFSSNKSYTDLFPKERLVYLSADSNNLLEKLDKDDYYIIGGIVDHNRYKRLTIEKAEKEGIRHCKLPIAENIKLSACKVLTVNHVFEILLRVSNNESWKDAILNTVPQRKNAMELAQVAEEEQKVLK